jgi:hypothetical protein
MADPSSPNQFEDISLDEARTMGCGPRIDPEQYRALQQKIQSLDTTAVHMTILKGTSSTTMKNRILRVDATLYVPVAIRNVPRGLLLPGSRARRRHRSPRMTCPEDHGHVCTRRISHELHIPRISAT